MSNTHSIIEQQSIIIVFKIQIKVGKRIISCPNNCKLLVFAWETTEGRQGGFGVKQETL